MFLTVVRLVLQAARRNVKTLAPDGPAWHTDDDRKPLATVISAIASASHDASRMARKVDGIPLPLASVHPSTLDTGDLPGVRCLMGADRTMAKARGGP